MTPFTLCAATSSGNPHNNHYPNHHHITDQTSLEQVAWLDHVAATYTGDRRSSASFISSDCVVMDIDNDHTDNPDEWITPDDLAELMAGVEFMTVTSRNHQKPKRTLSARPRFHVYFPISPVTDADTYAGLKRRLAGRFGFFDPQALDAGRFIYGTTNPETTIHNGTKLLDAWLDEADEIDVFAAFDASTQVIGEGSRNATLSRFAGRVLIRYGQTAQARDLFDRKASLCEPPLSDHELESIWQSACRFAAKVEAQPGYLSPEAYAELTSLRPEDFTDVGQASMLTAEYSSRLAFTEATDWLVYEGGVWSESAPAAQGIAQELTDRQLAEAGHLLEKARDELMVTGANAVLAAASSKAKALGGFTSPQRAAYRAFEDAKAYEAFVLKRRESRAITSCLREAHPMLLTTPARLDADPYLLNTPGGTWDVRDGTRRDHNPLDLITKQTALDPTDTGAEIWNRALNVFFQSDRELIGYVQRIVGLAAIGTVMVEALVIAYGDGRNGKSTFWNTIARVLGTYAGNMSADVLTIGGNRNVKPELAEAKGKQLIIAAESEEGVRLSTSTVKQLASTDQIYAEKKYKAPFAFTPSHTLILYTNHLPRVGAMDAGIWRRLIVIPFNAVIESSSDVKNYADHLYETAGGAVLAWIMEGSRLIHAEDYQLAPPAQVVAASSAYREENNWFAQFLDARCEVDPSLSERAGDLYQEYRAWAQSTSGWARPMADFNATLEQSGFERRKSKHGMYVYGLALTSEFNS